MTFLDLHFIFLLTVDVLPLRNVIGGPSTIILHAAHLLILHLETLNIGSDESKRELHRIHPTSVDCLLQLMTVHG